MKIINRISRLLDQTTMYRVVLYVLIAWAVILFGFSFTNLVYFGPVEMVLSLAALLASTIFAHYILAFVFGAPANIESTLITALILYFLFDPTLTITGLAALAGVGVLSILGKYILVWRQLHIVNPVVFAAVAASVIGMAYATWWVATAYMVPFMIIGGLLIMAKIRRFELVAATILTALIVHLGVVAWYGEITPLILWTFFASWPILFFATVMVTEPLSTPAGRSKQIAYGGLVGGLSSLPYAIPIGFTTLYSTPELALLIGNLVFWPFSLRARMRMIFLRSKQIGHNTYEFVFRKDRGFKYIPGQYMEWTLPHKSDARGVARYFTIASAPSESEAKLGLRIQPEKGSSYKQAMMNLEVGDPIFATSLDGDFVLPDDRTVPIVMISGGIGVTPFRSMVAEMINQNDKRDIVHFYCNKHEADIAYRDIWDAGETVGVKTVNVLTEPDETWQGERGFITADMLERHVNPHRNTLYYISGPPGMVNAYKKLLKSVGIKQHYIITDYFPGLA